MSRRTPRVESVSREMLERIAHIIGPASAAALTLKDAAERFGDDAQFWRVDNAFVSGPAGAPPPTPETFA